MSIILKTEYNCCFQAVTIYRIIRVLYAWQVASVLVLRRFSSFAH